MSTVSKFVICQKQTGFASLCDSDIDQVKISFVSSISDFHELVIYELKMKTLFQWRKIV